MNDFFMVQHEGKIESLSANQIAELIYHRYELDHIYREERGTLKELSYRVDEGDSNLIYITRDNGIIATGVAE